MGTRNLCMKAKIFLSFIVNRSFLTCIGEDGAGFLTLQIKKSKLICEFPSLYCYTKLSENETPARNFSKDTFIIQAAGREFL